MRPADQGVRALYRGPAPTAVPPAVTASVEGVGERPVARRARGRTACAPSSRKSIFFPALLARAYGDRAMALLRQGFRRGSGRLDRLKADRNLAPLRPRADFQKLVRDL